MRWPLSQQRQKSPRAGTASECGMCSGKECSRTPLPRTHALWHLAPSLPKLPATGTVTTNSHGTQGNHDTVTKANKRAKTERLALGSPCVIISFTSLAPTGHDPPSRNKTGTGEKPTGDPSRTFLFEDSSGVSFVS